MDISFVSGAKAPFDTLVVPMTADKRVAASQNLVPADGVALAIHLWDTHDFKGKAGEIAVHVLPPRSFAKRLVVLGVGDVKAETLKHEETGGKLAAALHAAKVVKAHVAADALPGAVTAALANGAALRSYEFRMYKTREKDKAFSVQSLQLVTGAKTKEAQKAYEPLAIVTEGVVLARNLVSEPPNVLYPESYAARIKDMAESVGLTCTIFGKKDLKKMGMGAFFAVGQGSDFDAAMVVLEHKPKGAKGQPIALVGKGITFDSGGLCIKPGASMPEMKADMGGSAAVIGTMLAIAKADVSRHVIGAVALAENMPSDDAYRPGDVLTSLSGQTIEVLNTDAEGRLVLCDTMTYVQKTYKPHTMIDVATLTGAAIVALGETFAAVYATDDVLFANLADAAKASGDLIWRMPLHATYDKDVNSDIADMRNIGSAGKGGSCTAAAFLHRFVDDGVKWAHLDMAPTMWSHKDTDLNPKGATGWGVRILTQWLMQK